MNFDRFDKILVDLNNAIPDYALDAEQGVEKAEFFIKRVKTILGE